LLVVVEQAHELRRESEDLSLEVREAPLLCTRDPGEDVLVELHATAGQASHQHSPGYDLELCSLSHAAILANAAALLKRRPSSREFWACCVDD
jgi:hypothetical protein